MFGIFCLNVHLKIFRFFKIGVTSIGQSSLLGAALVEELLDHRELSLQISLIRAFGRHVVEGFTSGWYPLAMWSFV